MDASNGPLPPQYHSVRSLLWGSDSLGPSILSYRRRSAVTQQVGHLFKGLFFPGRHLQQRFEDTQPKRKHDHNRDDNTNNNNDNSNNDSSNTDKNDSHDK